MKRALFWVLLFSYSCVSLAAITTHVEPSTITLGESFRLTLTLENIQSNGTPELIALQRDFNIDATEHSVSSSIINGKAETINQWTVILSPKKTGTLPIPPIKIGQTESEPSQINVTGEPQPDKPTPPHVTPPSTNTIQLITQTSEPAPYLHQQILYTVKLFHQEQLLDANYQPPQLENALIVPLGNSQTYPSTLNGQQYMVEEQQYALFPQQTGKQTILGPSFQALVYDGMPKRVQAHAQPTTLNIKPTPKTYQGQDWLPAKALALTEHYDQSTETLAKGSTLIRTIKLQGVGIPAELLPSLSANPQDTFGVYPEKPQLNNTINNQDVVGTTSLQITYLLNQAGDITLPAYTFSWFNTTTGQEETSTLPARTLHINGHAPSHTRPLNIKSRPSDITITHSSSQPTALSTRLPWGMTALFALAWLITLLLFFKQKKTPAIVVTPKHGDATSSQEPDSRVIKKTEPPQDAPNSVQSKRQLEKIVREACLQNHPKQAQAAVLSWGKLRWPNKPMAHLEDVIKNINDETFIEQLTLLSKTIYSQTPYTTWHGDQLWACIKQYQDKSGKQKKKTTLPPLNPS